MKKVFILIPALTILIYSCQKSIFRGDTLIHGQVVVDDIHMPLEKAKVAVISYKSGFLSPRYDFRTEAVVYSDEAGYYRIVLEKEKIEKGREFYLSAYKADANVYPANIYNISPYKDLYQKIKLKAVGWAKVNFRNNSGDTVNRVYLDGLTLDTKYFNGFPPQDSFLIGSYMAGFPINLQAYFEYFNRERKDRSTIKEVTLIPFDTISINFYY